LVSPTDRGLEIGPGYNPMFPKSEGFNVKTVDHGTGEELRAKYAHTGAADRIEDVNYVWRGEPLHELIGEEGAFDFIFSSHCLEHIPDPLGHLQSCQRLLKPGGVVLLALPDMRYCFDAMRNPSTTGEIIAATGRAKHTPTSLFDGTADFCRMAGSETWSAHHRGAVTHFQTLEMAKHYFDRASNPDDEYIDGHGWAFTPTSFRLLIADLDALSLINFRIKWMAETGIPDFHVVLSADAEIEQMSRIQLKRHLMKERALSAVQLLGGSEDLRVRLFQELSINDDIAIITP
jgi:SAM-dependent methyltransferase